MPRHPLRIARSLLVVLTVLLMALTARAQVTGVAGINDYTINGSIPGSTSCNNICLPPPVTVVMQVSTVPNTAVFFIWNPCPCRACVTPWTLNSCLPVIPLATIPPCSGTTNQSLDMLLSPNCPIIWSGLAISSAAGIATISIPIPPLTTLPCAGPRFSTQAVVVNTCGTGGPPAGPGPFVLTQAYNLVF